MSQELRTLRLMRKQKQWSRFLILLILTAMGSLPSCGFQNRAVKSSTNPNIPMYDFLTPREAQNQFKKWEVKCKDATKCPDSVGQLLVIDGASFGGCTATLISEDLVLTNSHCLDFKDQETGKMVEPEKLCENGTVMIFPNESPSGRDVVRCKKVLTKSILGSSRIYSDYLVLQLEHALKRPFDTVVREGLQDGEKLTVRKINPNTKGYGELIVETCEVAYRTAFLPGAKTPDFYLHAVTGCEVIMGNSGSSLVNAEGHIKAIVFAGVLQQDSSGMTDWQKSLIKKAREIKTSLVTNTTCIKFDFPKTTPMNVEKCEKNIDELGKLEDLLDPTDFRRRLNSQISSERSRLPKSMGYKLHMTQGSNVAFFAPGCFTAGASRREEYARAPVVMWQASYVASDKLRPVVELQSYRYSCDIRWSPEKLLQTRQTTVILMGNFCFDSTGNRGTQKSTWGLCEP